MTREDMVTKVIEEISRDAQSGDALYKDKWVDTAYRIVKLFDIPDVRLSLFNEVYEKFVECEDDSEFTQYLNENTNEA